MNVILIGFLICDRCVVCIGFIHRHMRGLFKVLHL